MCWQPITTLQNRTPKWAGHNPKVPPKEQSIMKYQAFEKLHWKPSKDVSRKSSWNHNVTPKKSKSSDSFSTVPPIVNGGHWGCIVHDLENSIFLVLLTFNFIPKKLQHSPTLLELMVQGLCNYNGSVWGWHNSYKSVVIGITDKLILQYGKKL